MSNQSHKFIENMQQHIDAEKLLQGATGENGKGCFIYCAVNQYNHWLMANEIGWPLQLVHIAETIFEGLDVARSQMFAVDILKAAKPNADLSLVHWKFLHWMLEDTLKKYGTPDVRKGCSKSLDVLKDLSKGKKIIGNDASAARDAARDAYAVARVNDNAAYWVANAVIAANATATSANAANAVIAAATAAGSDRDSRFQEFAEKLIEIIGEAS